MRIHEAWYKIAEGIAEGEHFFICTGIHRTPMPPAVREEIRRRLDAERVRQGLSPDSMGCGGLWRSEPYLSERGRVLRLLFIAKELRILALKGGA